MRPEIWTYPSCTWMNLVDPKPEMVHIEDIANALSNICRFTGHVKKFYSVALHSVRVSYLVPPEDALQALLHDATEAYMSDINSPLKHTDALAGYRLLEQRMWEVIAEKYGIPAELSYNVKEADAQALWEEMRDPELSILSCEKLSHNSFDDLVGYAGDIFLNRFNQLYEATSEQAI